MSETPEIALVFGRAGDKPMYGKAYFELVTELRQRRSPFLSLTVTDPIPAYVRVVVTTGAESRFIKHPCVVVYDGRGSRSRARVVDRIIRLARGKEISDELVIGIDPGERVGVAAVIDGKVGKAGCYSGVRETVNMVGRIVQDVEAQRKVVKVGSSFKSIRDSLILELNRVLPSNVALEVVPEELTTRGSTSRRPGRRGLRDIYSALEIATRKGRSIRRGL